MIKSLLLLFALNLSALPPLSANDGRSGLYFDQGSPFSVNNHASCPFS